LHEHNESGAQQHPGDVEQLRVVRHGVSWLLMAVLTRVIRLTTRPKNNKCRVFSQVCTESC
jgi:hypothetical protein